MKLTDQQNNLKPTSANAKTTNIFKGSHKPLNSSSPVIGVIIFIENNNITGESLIECLRDICLS